jgi:phage-related holin
MIARAFTRIPASLITFAIALLVFSNLTLAIIAALSYLFGSWFSATSVLVVIAAVRIISDEPAYSYAAGLAFEVGLRIYLAFSRLKSGSL